MNKGINRDYLDIETDPAIDFYMFVNGGWMISTEIPEDRSSWGSFHELSRDTDEKVLGILDEELEQAGPAINKAARLFESGMNIVQIEKARLQGIAEVLQDIRSLDNASSFSGLLGELTQIGLGSIIQFSVHPDLGDSKKYAAYLEPGMLGLPERDFYLESDEKALKIREQYLVYIRYILEKEAQYSMESAAETAEKILSLETALAGHMLPKEQRRQIALLYNPYTYQELVMQFGGISWDSFFSHMQIEAPPRVIMTEPEYFNFLNSFLADTSTEDIKHYMTFMAIHHVAPYAHSSLE